MPYAHVREVTVGRDGQLKVDGLPFEAGDRVQLFVIRRKPSREGRSRYPLRGKAIRYESPFEPAIDPSEWGANQ